MPNVRLFLSLLSCEAEKITKESIKTKTEIRKFLYPCCVKYYKLRVISIVMSTNLEIEKEKVALQASEFQRERELEHERKNKGDIFS